MGTFFMKIITLVGYHGSGKTITASILEKYHGYSPFSFADALKDVSCSIFGYDRVMIDGRTKEHREQREKIDYWWAQKLGIPNFCPLKSLEIIGTDVMRQYFNPNIWIYAVERRLSILPVDAKIVIVDARYPNEIEMVNKMGSKIAKIIGPNVPSWEDVGIAAASGDINAIEYFKKCEIHDSQWSWLSSPVDLVIENQSQDFDKLKSEIRKKIIDATA